MAEQKKVYTSLDVAKFLCALFILFYHFFSEIGSLPAILEEVLSLYAVAVALFMIISGFLTFDRLQAVEGTKKRWQHVKKQVKRILTIYLLWSIPYLIYSISRWDFANLSLPFVLKQLQGWIFGSTFYTIWFMPALAVGLILAFWITEKLPKPLIAVIAVLLYLLGSLTLTYSFLGNAIPHFSLFKDILETWLGGGRGWLCFATPLLILGKQMVPLKNKVKPKPMALLSVLCMAVLLIEAILLKMGVGGTGIDLALTMPLAVFVILGFLVALELPSGRYSILMRKMSVLIFMSQRLFLTVLPSLCPVGLAQVLFVGNFPAILTVCGGTVLLSAIILALSGKIPFLKHLY